MSKKKIVWNRPKLIVLTKHSEEHILAFCKAAGGYLPENMGPNNYVLHCTTTYSGVGCTPVCYQNSIS
jgi:hypothetical protein